MMKNSLFLALAFGAFALCASADVIPTNDSQVPEGGNFRWNYATNVTVDQMVQTGDYFTIYDFGSLVPGSNLQPAGWVFSTSLLGLTPPTVLPNDDPNVMNITWTYTGATPINGQSFLGMFSVLSTTDQMRTDNFAAHATRNGGPQSGQGIDNIGTVGVPVPEMSALAPIIGISGLGLIGAFSSFARRRKAS